MKEMRDEEKNSYHSACLAGKVLHIVTFAEIGTSYKKTVQTMALFQKFISTSSAIVSHLLLASQSNRKIISGGVPTSSTALYASTFIKKVI